MNISSPQALARSWGPSPCQWLGIPRGLSVVWGQEGSEASVPTGVQRLPPGWAGTGLGPRPCSWGDLGAGTAGCGQGCRAGDPSISHDCTARLGPSRPRSGAVLPRDKRSWLMVGGEPPRGLSPGAGRAPQGPDSGRPGLWGLRAASAMKDKSGYKCP